MNSVDADRIKELIPLTSYLIVTRDFKKMAFICWAAMKALWDGEATPPPCIRASLKALLFFKMKRFLIA